MERELEVSLYNKSNYTFFAYFRIFKKPNYKAFNLLSFGSLTCIRFWTHKKNKIKKDPEFVIREKSNILPRPIER